MVVWPDPATCDDKDVVDDDDDGGGADDGKLYCA